MRSRSGQTVTSPTHRTSVVNSNSSAFSASANPNEDWTKISDLAERRRIQNRIAQRNYRKKLKKRLQDLERRANSTSASPEPENQESSESTSPPNNAADTYNSPSAAPVAQYQSRSRLSYDHNASSNDERITTDQRTRSLPTIPTLAPAFSYPAYQPDEKASNASHHTAQEYRLQPMASIEVPLYGTHLTAGIPTSQTLHGILPVKHEYFDEDYKAFSMNYAPTPGTSLSSTQSRSSYMDSNFNTPPLSDCINLDYFEAAMSESTPGSAVDLWDSLFAQQPLTPESMDDRPQTCYFS